MDICHLQREYLVFYPPDEKYRALAQSQVCRVENTIDLYPLILGKRVCLVNLKLVTAKDLMS